MPKVFLSHSSKDKKSYVDQLARILTKQIGNYNVIYDSFSFEEGMKNIEEIERGLGKSDLFVLLLSDTALESEWVKTELEKAAELQIKGKLSRIFPIIIDDKVNYSDERIPDWMRKEYNLKPVRRPTVASRRIIQRLREIEWALYPKLKERNRLFVGRNELIKAFEERIDSIDSEIPLCIIASGLKSIGRRTLLEKCLKKANIVLDSYKPPTIFLDSHESLEDFIYKVYDLGFSGDMDLYNFLHRKIEDKIELAYKLMLDIQKHNEILFILDDGCIVNPERKMNKWFMDLLDKLKDSATITFCIASTFRIHKHTIFDKEYIFTLEVPELDKMERTGLLKRYSAIEGINLKKDDFEFIVNLLNGYPEQVFYSVNLIKDMGITSVKKQSYLISEYNSEKVTQILNKFSEDEKAIDFLFFLSGFDFISYELIFEIVGEETYYKKLLNDFLAMAICENFGANNEYLRVNDAIRDYIRRQRLTLSDFYKEKLKEHLTEFLNNYKNEERDVSDFLFSVKEALLTQKDIDEKYLIPSHFLKTMKELYDSGSRYDEVINLADRVLENKEFMDPRIEFEIQYYLCLSLARQRNSRFLEEVQKITGAEHNFLLGFYYRLNNDNIKALDKLHLALSQRPNFSRAKRELVQVYLLIEEYEKAYELAKENYETDKNNPYHIQAFFQCVSNKATEISESDKKRLLSKLLNNLEKIKTEKANQMFLGMKAEYLAFYEDNEEEAIEQIEDAIKKYFDNLYLQFTKFSICEKYNKFNEMKDVLNSINMVLGKNKKSPFYNKYLKCKAIYLSKSGDLSAALKVLEEMRSYPENSLEKLRAKIERNAEFASKVNN